MKISFWSIGKAHEASLKVAIEDFTKRISHYYPAGWNIIPAPKNSSNFPKAELVKKEAALVESLLKPDDYLIILDEKGKQLRSVELSNLIVKCGNESVKHLVFLIGGAYGIDRQLHQKAKKVISLSPLTFPHQLVRLILAEQVYRACTIMKNENYHHD
jgi:23S rRNA (pseudouridine1915-N3)-methyltransferase